MAEEKLYNVYGWNYGSLLESSANVEQTTGLIYDDAVALYSAYLDRGPNWDAYMVDADADAENLLEYLDQGSF